MIAELNAAVTSEGVIELWKFFEDGGPIIRCYPDGKIELFEVPQYGGEERSYGYYSSVNAAWAEAATWT